MASWPYGWSVSQVRKHKALNLTEEGSAQVFSPGSLTPGLIISCGDIVRLEAQPALGRQDRFDELYPHLAARGLDNTCGSLWQGELAVVRMLQLTGHGNTWRPNFPEASCPVVNSIWVEPIKPELESYETLACLLANGLEGTRLCTLIERDHIQVLGREKNYIHRQEKGVFIV